MLGPFYSNKKESPIRMPTDLLKKKVQEISPDLIERKFEKFIQAFSSQVLHLKRRTAKPNAMKVFKVKVKL